jgi:hypothetical protein
VKAVQLMAWRGSGRLTACLALGRIVPKWHRRVAAELSEELGGMKWLIRAKAGQTPLLPTAGHEQPAEGAGRPPRIV